jgi:hypothetical protein
MWIDIEDAAGNKLSSGPLTTASGWRQTKRLKRAGEFAFTFPASDPKAADLTYRRRVRCWEFDPLLKRLVDGGSGVVETLRTSVDASGAAIIQVMGGDLLRELADRTVGDLKLMVESTYAPTEVSQQIASPPSGDVLTDAYDGNLGTSENVTLTGSATGAPNDWIYVGHTKEFSRVSFTLGVNVNAVNSELRGQFLSTYADGSVGWESAKITTDGTKTGAAPNEKTFAQSGIVTFDPPSGWEPLGSDYLVRFYVTADIDDVDFAEIEVKIFEPTTTALADVMAFAPAGWSLDAGLGYTATKAGVYLTMSGESVLTTLIRIAEHTGENFTGGFGRNLIWLQDEQRDSGLRAVAHIDPIAAEDAPEIVLISDLQAAPDGDASDIISRVYPFGGGIAKMRPTLALTTKSAPAGYTLDTTNNYLKCDATETAYGRIEVVQAWSDIVAKDTSGTQKAEAADALFDRALEFLQEHATPLETYSANVLKLSRPLLPGYRVRVVYDEFVDGYHAVAVDAVLWVIDTTTEINASGVHMTGLQMATLPRAPQTSAGLSTNSMAQSTGLAAVAPPTLGRNSTALGTPSFISVENGMVTAINRVAGVSGTFETGQGGLGNMGEIRVENGIIVAVTEAS